MLPDELFRRFMKYSSVRAQNFDKIDFLLLGEMIKMCVNIRSCFHEKIQSRVVIIFDDLFPGSFDFVVLRHNQLKKLGLIYDMVAYVYSCNDVYKYRLAKTRENVLKGLYEKPSIEKPKKTFDNPRLRFRFREAIREAHKICDSTKNSYECELAWYEVDELEDAMMRQGLKD